METETPFCMVDKLLATTTFLKVMDMVSCLSPWDDDYIPEGLVACHGKVLVAQIYDMRCYIMSMYVC